MDVYWHSIVSIDRLKVVLSWATTHLIVSGLTQIQIHYLSLSIFTGSLCPVLLPATTSFISAYIFMTFYKKIFFVISSSDLQVVALSQRVSKRGSGQILGALKTCTQVIWKARKFTHSIYLISTWWQQFNTLTGHSWWCQPSVRSSLKCSRIAGVNSSGSSRSCWSCSSSSKTLFSLSVRLMSSIMPLYFQV